MKKLILLLVIGLMTLTSNSQNSLDWKIKKTKTDDVFAMSLPKKDILGVQPEFNLNSNINKIDLKLYKYKEPDQNKRGGLALLFGGIAFTAASILESGDGKIYQGETARQIMLGTGIVLTISGVIVIGNN